MTREEQIVEYANSFKGKGIESDELKEIIHLAIIDGAKWADAHPQEPPLPSDFNEAATNYAWEEQEMVYDAEGQPFFDYGTRYDSFKAGAKWMAEQGETVFGIITKVGDKLDVETTEYLTPEESEFKRGDKVIVQIQKQ